MPVIHAPTLIKSMLRLITFLSTLFFASIATAAENQPPRDPAAENSDEPETELTKHMDKMNGAFRKLRRQVADAAKNADSLEQVVILREHAAAAAKLAPAKAEKIPEADRAKFVADYRSRMSETVATIDKLAAALKAGQNEEAAKIIAEIGNQQRSGHKEYRVEKKK